MSCKCPAPLSLPIALLPLPFLRPRSVWSSNTSSLAQMMQQVARLRREREGRRDPSSALPLTTDEVILEGLVLTEELLAGISAAFPHTHTLRLHCCVVKVGGGIAQVGGVRGEVGLCDLAAYKRYNAHAPCPRGTAAAPPRRAPHALKASCRSETT